MAGKITNLLREGLPSKIYLLAYNKPVSGYGIAQKIQGLHAGAVPQTGKIYGWIKELKVKDFLIETKDGVQSKVEPLLPEIQQVLSERQITLSDLELHITRKVLDSEAFRNWVEYFLYRNKKNFQKNIDAVDEILNILGNQALVTSNIASKQEEPSPNIQNQAEFDRLWVEDSFKYRELTVEEIESCPKLKAKAAEYDEEDKFFKKHNTFKKGGLYEKFARDGRMVIEGKKIKDLSFPPPTFSLMPHELKDKLCHLSAAYELFQQVFTGVNMYLFRAFVEKKVKEEDLLGSNDEICL